MLESLLLDCLAAGKQTFSSALGTSMCLLCHHTMASVKKYEGGPKFKDSCMY